MGRHRLHTPRPGRARHGVHRTARTGALPRFGAPATMAAVLLVGFPAGLASASGDEAPPAGVDMLGSAVGTATGTDRPAPDEGPDGSATEGAGSEGTGSKKAGSTEAAAEKAAPKKAAPEKAGSQEAGSQEAGSEAAGSQEAGSEKGGSQGTGSEEAGSEKGGSQESGSEEAGSAEAGSEASGPREPGQDPAPQEAGPATAEDLIESGMGGAGTTQVTLTEKNDSGVSGAAEIDPERVLATATGMDPGARYVSFFYGATSSATNNNPCILDGTNPLPSEQTVGEWQVDENGNGTLSADNPLGARYALQAGTISVRKVEHDFSKATALPVNPVAYSLVACGEVQRVAALDPVTDVVPKLPAFPSVPPLS